MFRQFQDYNIFLIQQLRNQNIYYQNQIHTLKGEVSSLKGELVDFNARKPYFNLHKKNQDIVVNKIKSQVIKINRRLKPYGILMKEINLCILDRENENNIILVKIFNNYFPNNYDLISINYALFIKDKYFISDEKYGVIRNNYNSNIPPFYQIKALREKLNESHHIYSIGCDKVKFIDIKIEIKKKIYQYLSSAKETELITIKELRIKFSADGTNIGKNVFLVNFCFCLINDEKNKSSSGNYTIGMGEIEESYDALVNPLNYIMDQMRDLKIVFKNKTFNISYFFGADMKFLLLVNGLKAANSSFPCLWCLVSKKDLYKLDFSILNLNQSRDKRKYEELANKGVDFGFKAVSLLSKIPLIKCIIDTLHLRIRIGLKLIELFLINDLIIMDNYDGKDLINENHVNLTIWYYSFIKKKCKSGARLIKYNKDNKAKITRDFNGKEIISIFRFMNFKTFFPNLEDLEKKQKLWRLFYWIDRGNN